VKTPEDHNNEFNAGLRRFDRLLPTDADELTVVLKGHLLIEEQLRAITRVLMANPQYFDKARLTFANALQLARAVAGHFNKGACWSAAEKLNSLRNQLAHQAEPSTPAELYEPFFSVCESEPVWSGARPMPRGVLKLRIYISYIWSTLDALRTVVEVCAETAPSPLTRTHSHNEKP